MRGLECFGTRHRLAEPHDRYQQKCGEHELTCDFIEGCDGFHGICRPALGDPLNCYDRTYPFGWLGILAETPPSSESLVYTYCERGFALYSMRSQKITRLYFQVPPDEDIRDWSDDASWEEMLKRMASCDGCKPNVGPILHKNVTDAQFCCGTHERRAPVFGR